MKRTPLRPVSKKREKALKEYYELRKEYLSATETCEVCGRRDATQIHHMGTPGGVKRGSNLNNVETWLGVCSECHRKIEDNKAWARQAGYLA